MKFTMVAITMGVFFISTIVALNFSQLRMHNLMSSGSGSTTSASHRVLANKSMTSDGPKLLRPKLIKVNLPRLPAHSSTTLPPLAVIEGVAAAMDQNVEALVSFRAAMQNMDVLSNLEYISCITEDLPGTKCKTGTIIPTDAPLLRMVIGVIVKVFKSHLEIDEALTHLDYLNARKIALLRNLAEEAKYLEDKYPAANDPSFYSEVWSKGYRQLMAHMEDASKIVGLEVIHEEVAIGARKLVAFRSAV